MIMRDDEATGLTAVPEADNKMIVIEVDTKFSKQFKQARNKQNKSLYMSWW